MKFVGHGGTSAGSMIALMAAVGYSGSQLEKILVDDLVFTTLLDDDGDKLLRTQEKVEEISSALKSGSKLSKLWAINWAAPGVLKSLGPRLGFYEGRAIKAYILERIKAVVPALATNADVTFEHLKNAGCLPVKIVASDLTLRRPAVFSADQTEYGASVVDAVRASTCYPFAFEPVFLNGRYLVDGGLSSNLPVFLFAEEYRRSRIPALAFDLSAPAGSGQHPYDLNRYGADLLATALEASDELLRKVLRGVHYIPVETPQGIDTLDFGLSRDDRKRLFDAGHKATTECLANLEQLKRVKMAGDQLQRQLWVEFGTPQLYTPVLHALSREIESRTNAKDVRAHVMLPTGRPEATRIVTYQFGMEGDSDIDLELPELAGCSGRAWSDRVPAFADLTQAAKNPSPWGMTAQQHAKVPTHRKSMLSVPIHAPLRPDDVSPPTPVGTLSVDSSTPLAETKWLEETSQGIQAHFQVVTTMMQWAYIIHRLLP